MEVAARDQMESICERRPEFSSLLNSLHPKASKWEMIGVAFGLNTDSLAIIGANSMEVEVRLKRVLDEVYKTQPKLTWKDVIENLKQPLLSEDVLAQQLEDQLHQLKLEKKEVPLPLKLHQKKLQPTVTITAEPSNPVEIVKRNQIRINRKFASLVYNVRKRLEAMDIDMNDFSEFILTFFGGDVGQKLVSGPSLKVGDIFRSITKHKLWDYTNYYYIEEILEEFGGDDRELAQWVRDYKMDLGGFKAVTKIADFIDCFKLSGGAIVDTASSAEKSLRQNLARYDPTYYSNLSVKLETCVAEKCLYYVDDIWKSVADHFMLPSLPVLLDSICEGCVEVTWIVPSTHAMQIQWNVDGATEFLERNGILRVAVDNQVIYDNMESLSGMELVQACIKGDLDLVTALLLHGVNANEGDDVDGMTPLLCAAREGHVDIVQALLEAGVNFNKSENNGYTPLMVSSVNGRYQVVFLLLHNGANVHATTKGGWSAISLACQRSHLEVVQLLLQFNASILATRDKAWTPLMYVCNSAKESVEIVELLIKKGSKVNYWALDTWSPLKLACERGYMGVAKVLLDNGAKVNDRKGSWWTPLYFAAAEGHTEMCGMLLQCGANVDSSTGSSPLVVASLKGHPSVVRLLLQHKANVDATCQNGLSALYYACHGGHLEVVETLVTAGASLTNVSEGRGFTVLMAAAANGNYEVVQYLLEHQIPIDATDKNDCTALVYACHGGHTAIVRELLQHGASTSKTTGKGGMSPLMVAAANGHEEVVGELLSAGADINYMEDSAGWSTLMIAAGAGHLPTVQLLLKKGADVSMKAKGTGATAHNIASANEHAQIVQELKHHGITSTTTPTKEIVQKISQTRKNYQVNMENIQLFKTANQECVIMDVPKTNSSSYQRSSLQLSQHRHF